MKGRVPEVTRIKNEGKCRQSIYNYNREGKMKENNINQRHNHQVGRGVYLIHLLLITLVPHPEFLKRKERRQK